MKTISILLLVSSAIGLGVAAHDLEASYPFSAVLFDDQGQYYGLHWNFTRSTETMYFAVNVSTTGWIGFGLSPNGQMPGSDVVIGWVSNAGENYFHDRYAVERALPPIDMSQDWFLLTSEEADGFTILEFSRSFISCDTSRDLDIMPITARVVWSFSVSDPTDPLGSDARQHNYQGTRSINLLGGLAGGNRAVSEDEPFFDTAASNVVIPEDPTTYWCTFLSFPDEVVNTTSFINRVSPVITPHSRSFVHHLTVYRCHFNLTDEEVGMSVSCADLNERLTECRFGSVLGGWAVGGEDFIYPEGIAQAVGGPLDRGDNFVVLETHYDNPGMETGVTDSSGLRFFYSTEEPEQRAGVLFLGHDVRPWMMIPPRLQNFTIAAVCTAPCTNAYIPEEGIRIFGNFFHTHLIGQRVVLEHYRPNPETNEIMELEPIDINPSYDFNFQQFNHLPREHLVLPGDILVTKCIYNSMERESLTFGGLSTLDEMCLTFPVYYPVAPDGSSLFKCVSNPNLPSSFNAFIAEIQSVGLAQNLTADSTLEDFLGTMAALPWNTDLARSLQDTVLESEEKTFCDTATVGHQNDNAATVPVADRPFQAPNRIYSRCTNTTAVTPSGAQSWMHSSEASLSVFIAGILALTM